MNRVFSALTTVLERVGGVSLAQAWLSAVVRWSPANSRLAFLAVRLAAKKRWFVASVRLGQSVLARRPQAADVVLVVADSCLASKQFSLACTYARQFIVLRPDCLDGYQIASESLQLMGDSHDSIAVLEQGLQRCAAGSGAVQGRSRHLQRHVKAYRNRDWFPLYDLWREAVLRDEGQFPMDSRPRTLLFRPQAIQYWSQGEPPADVRALTAQWNALFASIGLPSVAVFSRVAARDWIAEHRPVFLPSFDSAPHYSAESDVFRIAHASVADTFWIDSDLAPGRYAKQVLQEALSRDASLLFLKRKVPYFHNCAFIARRGCPLFQAMARDLEGFDYEDPALASVSKLKLLENHGFGPAMYGRALEAFCRDHGPVRRDSSALPVLQTVVLPVGTLSFFRGDDLVTGAGDALAYKHSNDHWKVWARG